MPMEHTRVLSNPTDLTKPGITDPAAYTKMGFYGPSTEE
jgi:hypothetical protein